MTGTLTVSLAVRVGNLQSRTTCTETVPGDGTAGTWKSIRSCVADFKGASMPLTRTQVPARTVGKSPPSEKLAVCLVPPAVRSLPRTVASARGARRSVIPKPSASTTPPSDRIMGGPCGSAIGLLATGCTVTTCE